MNNKIYKAVYDRMFYHLGAQTLRQWGEREFRWIVRTIVDYTIEELNKETK